jgi:hypothetical protein
VAVKELAASAISQRRWRIISAEFHRAPMEILMITYLYWLFVIAVVVAALWFIGFSMKHWGPALIAAAAVFVIGVGAYFFHFQQIFVKRWGGVMSVVVPEGQYHMNLTWKDDNLWVENYDPANNTCEFREYSRGDLLQGRVIIKNCNPLKHSQ